MSSPALPASVAPMVEHIVMELAQHQAGITAGTPKRPLFVGVQGPQGSGKTYLTSILRDELLRNPHNLRVAVLSADDLYLPHSGLTALARAHPDNRLLHGRGQPGTHDLPLGTKLLSSLREINAPVTLEEPPRIVRLPVFDKSLHNGEGDRLPETEWPEVEGPLDVVLLEGWFVGFGPVTEEELDARYNSPEALKGLSRDIFDLQKFCHHDDVREINEIIYDYIDWWKQLDAFIQIAPEDNEPYSHIYKWRLQQEHAMKTRNGGRGMSDAEVKRFVDRYIPGYVFFSDSVKDGFISKGGCASGSLQRTPPAWAGHGLRVIIGGVRDLLRTERF